MQRGVESYYDWDPRLDMVVEFDIYPPSPPPPDMVQWENRFCTLPYRFLFEIQSLESPAGETKDPQKCGDAQCLVEHCERKYVWGGLPSQGTPGLRPTFS